MENLFAHYNFEQPKTNAQSERADIIRQLVEGINRERIGTQWKPVQPRVVAIKVGHLKTNADLYYLLSICKNAKSFGACFFGSIKVLDKKTR